MGRKRLYSDEERKARAKEAVRRYQAKKKEKKTEPIEKAPETPVVAVDGYDPSPITDPDYTPFNIADAVLDKKSI